MPAGQDLRSAAAARARQIGNQLKDQAIHTVKNRVEVVERG